MAPTGQGWDDLHIKKENNFNRLKQIQIYLNTCVYNKYKLNTSLATFKGYNGNQLILRAGK